MNDRYIIRFMAASLSLVIVNVAIGLLLIYRQFPHLEHYADTYLVRDSLQTNYAVSLCLAAIHYEQTLHTTQADGGIWQRMSDQWTEGESRILGNGGEAQYERDVMPFVTMRSRLFFHTARPHNTIFVNNQLTFQLPPWLCQPSAHTWPNSPVEPSFLH